MMLVFLKPSSKLQSLVFEERAEYGTFDIHFITTTIYPESVEFSAIFEGFVEPKSIDKNCQPQLPERLSYKSKYAIAAVYWLVSL